MSAETDLGWIFETHQAVYGGLLNLSVKCSACDGWTKGTIWDHRADLARQFFVADRDLAVAEALRPVRALHVQDPREGHDECVGCRDECLYCEGDHKWPCPTLRAALPDEAGEGS